MDQTTQESFRPVIDARLAEIEAELDAGADSIQPIAPDVAVGRLSRLDSMQMQQMALAGKRRLEEERGRLQAARLRIHTGEFGRCLRCGTDMALERLRHLPDAVVCVPCVSSSSAKRGA